MGRRKGHWSHEMKFGHKQTTLIFVDMIGPRSGLTFYGRAWTPYAQYVNACCGKGGFTCALKDNT